MTIEQFNNTAFSINTKIIYKGNEYEVVSVDFEESLICICTNEDCNFSWIRCENAEIRKAETATE